MDFNHFAITVQAAGTLIVALLFFLLKRAIPGRFLGYWSLAWAFAAVALGFLRWSLSLDGNSEKDSLAARISLSLYCGGAFTSVFLIWAGLRDYVRSEPLRRADGFRILVPLGFAAVAPAVLPSYWDLFPYYTAVMAAMFAVALGTTRGYKPTPGQPPVGMAVVRAGLIVLCVLFAHYGPVLLAATYRGWEPPRYVALSPVYDAMAGFVVAFGAVILAAERVRDEMAEKNRRLAEASRQLEQSARTDTLTGLFNRNAFEQILKEQAGAGAEFAGSLAVLDLNNLKPINDQFGHPAGDAALQLVARAVRNHFRVTDPLFRIGGDEFVAVMPDGTEGEMVARMRAIDAALVGQRLPGVAAPLDLSVAWGVSRVAAGADLPAAFARADKAMYAHKHESKHAARDAVRA